MFAKRRSFVLVLRPPTWLRLCLGRPPRPCEDGMPEDDSSGLPADLRLASVPETCLAGAEPSLDSDGKMRISSGTFDARCRLRGAERTGRGSSLCVSVEVAAERAEEDLWLRFVFSVVLSDSASLAPGGRRTVQLLSGKRQPRFRKRWRQLTSVIAAPGAASGEHGESAVHLSGEEPPPSEGFSRIGPISRERSRVGSNECSWRF